jgi:hypothetical protein
LSLCSRSIQLIFWLLNRSFPSEAKLEPVSSFQPDPICGMEALALCF